MICQSNSQVGVFPLCGEREMTKREGLAQRRRSSQEAAVSLRDGCLLVALSGHGKKIGVFLPPGIPMHFLCVSVGTVVGTVGIP